MKEQEITLWAYATSHLALETLAENAFSIKDEPERVLSGLFFSPNPLTVEGWTLVGKADAKLTFTVDAEKIAKAWADALFAKRNRIIDNAKENARLLNLEAVEAFPEYRQDAVITLTDEGEKKAKAFLTEKHKQYGTMTPEWIKQAIYKGFIDQLKDNYYATGEAHFFIPEKQSVDGIKINLIFSPTVDFYIEFP